MGTACNSDLHVHTTASDGGYPPSRVVEFAHEAGLTAIAISDHDTFDGLPEAKARGAELGVEIIPAVELSAYEFGVPVHILGLLVDLEREGAKNALAQIEEFKLGRMRRMEKMVEKLGELGINIDIEDVKRESGSGSIGRPHLASVLVAKGFISNSYEAFEKYIGNDGPAYVRKKEITPKEAIRLVHELGGVAVFAHPGVSKLDERIPSFVAAGLDGLEVAHPKHGAAQERHYRNLAISYKLAVSGGSDMHGCGRGDSKLGDRVTSSSELTALRKRKRSN